MQAINALNGPSGRQPNIVNPPDGKASNSLNRYMLMKKPGTALSSITGAQELHNDKMSGRSGTSVPLTARVSSHVTSTALNPNNEPRVKSLQRQPIVAQTEVKSGVNMIYKSPVRNVGGASTSMGKPRSAHGGEAKQSAANSGSFG